MRIIFAGSPAIAVPCLEKLAELQLETGIHALAGLLTNPDTPRGRKGTPVPTDTGEALDRLSGRYTEKGLPPPAQIKPEKLDRDAREQIAALSPDLLISFAYGRIFGPKFLELFPLGGINIHPSLLPEYRGATPIPAAILGRERETGITIQKLTLAMDAGDILAQERLPLSGRETTESLGALAAVRSAGMLEALLRDVSNSLPPGIPQDDTRASYCGLIKKEDGTIDWSADVLTIDARIRAFTPWPLSVTLHNNQELFILEGNPYGGTPPENAGSGGAEGGAVPGKVLGIDKQAGILVQTGEGIFAVTRLQYRTKKPLDWRSFLNGSKDFIGTVLG
ncbi:methionyl-tRNA formyltransferase [Breznakiella homolactica]|uniref:Methionyl-tRNA formyltransferase n=1 Tax=Breznakiella homolactica TaxID=2798577 RepID=A0A7T7XMD5_9SPIR|nr:methionyl-tRNA formyltransferase [Breznakiella homolactica]QQO08937.1 methionyl-tRNA formyltransferase [Breznakiella homolactica]